MGIWLELGIFLVILAWGLWQLHDVKKTIRERERAQTNIREHAQAKAPDAGSDDATA